MAGPVLLRRFLVVLSMLTATICPNHSATQTDFEASRAKMVREQIAARGISDERVLAAMNKVPRHLFVSSDLARRFAYTDQPLPIGEGQMISQPYIVAFMTEALKLSASSRVLEIGTGSGYQAAVLAEIVKEVFTIEIIPELGRSAMERLRKLGYHNIFVRIGDGYAGWPPKAPFDAIILTAAPAKIPEPLIQQLKIGGRLVAPVGTGWGQKLIRLTRTPEAIEQEHLLDVRFVPMRGEIEGK